jgi:hypothetical protein
VPDRIWFPDRLLTRSGAPPKLTASTVAFEGNDDFQGQEEG